MKPAKKATATERERKTVVYCGPTIPGTAKQYTIFNNGIPEGLEKRAEQVPAIRGLVIPLDDLPAAMKSLRSGAGHIYRLYRLVQAKL